MPRDPAVAAVFEPVQPPTTFEETVERLGTAIRLGILGPGVRLPSERELADPRAEDAQADQIGRASCRERV